MGLTSTELLLLMVVMLQAIFSVGWGLASRIQNTEQVTIQGFFFFNAIMCASLLLIAFRAFVPANLNKVVPLWTICISNYLLIGALHNFFRVRLTYVAGFWPLFTGAFLIFFFAYVHYDDTYRIAAFLSAILAANVIALWRLTPRLLREFGTLPLVLMVCAAGLLAIPIVWTTYLALFTDQAFGLAQSSALNDIAMFGLSFAVACPNLLFASLVSMRLVRESKERLLRDDVTQLLNYSAFMAVHESDWARRKQECEYAIAIALDLDGFSTTSLKYGHHVADHILRETARILTTAGGRQAIAGHTNRGEFVLVVRATSIESGRAVVQRIRAEMTATRWMTLVGGPSAQTASFGVAIDHINDLKASSVLSRAQDALSFAKRGQGDQIELAMFEGTLQDIACNIRTNL